MPTDPLQEAITELATFPDQPQAAWITKVSSAPTEVIAGAMVYWGPSGSGAYVTADPLAPRRQAAMAILQARFSAEAGKQTRQLIYLTWVIAALTAVMLVTAGVPLFTPTPTHAVSMSVLPPK
jgi:hypothetical protein